MKDPQEVSAVSAWRDAERPWRDHYKILGVEPSASARKITSAYRRLVRTLHPDSHPERPTAGERFAEVVDAYAVLHDPARRAAYDAERDRRSAGALRGRPVRVKVTGAPTAHTGRRDPLGGTVDPSHLMASLDDALLRVGPVRVYPDGWEVQGAFGLGGRVRVWLRWTTGWR
jgi:hypothetical protein